MTDFLAHVREHFPVLARQVVGRSIVYFDNAATTLKPDRVMDTVVRYYRDNTANIHRGKHLLSEEVSEEFENVRTKLAEFLNCAPAEVIFVSGATHGIHLVANGLSLTPGDNVVGTVLEHHSNILPWAARGEFRAAQLTEAGLPDIEDAARRIDERTRLLTVTACSNVTGIHVPLEPWVRLARAHDIPILVDAAQAVGHRRTDVRALDCDFLVLSSHKMCGPTGAGVLYGKRERLEALSVDLLGGGTVSVVESDFTYKLRELPWRLEAGTPDIAAVLGMGAAVDYLDELGFEAIGSQLAKLRRAMLRELDALDGFRSLHPSTELEAACIFSLVDTTGTFAPDFVSRFLSDTYGIMTRGGHHCAHPLHQYLDANGSLRSSLYFYNTEEEVGHLGRALRAVSSMRGSGR